MDKFQLWSEGRTGCVIETEKLLNMDKETSRSRQVIEGVLKCSRNCGFVALFAMLFFCFGWYRMDEKLE